MVLNVKRDNSLHEVTLDTFLNVRKGLSDFLVTFVALDKSYPLSRAE